MTGDRLSIALCTYNGARYLPAQLASLAAQHAPPDELVVCDDGSTDGSVELLQQFAAAAPFAVRIGVNASRLGTAANFAQAVERCTGDLIALCDQDDVWHPEKLARCHEAFARYRRAGAVFSDAQVVDADLRPLGYGVWQHLRFTRAEQRRMLHGGAFDVLVRRNVVLGATLVFRAAYRPLVLPIPPAWPHDLWIPLLIAAVADVVPLRAPLVQYRQHAAQQFGALRPSVPARIARALAADRAHYAMLARRHELAQDRLAAAMDYTVDPAHLRALAAKAAHFRARAALPQPRLRRVGVVLRELAARRYQRYAGGWAGAARDLAF